MARIWHEYETTSSGQVRIFDDRIEFWNPGRLPEGWGVEDLRRKHESSPHNPLLLKQFFWVKYVEEVGTGTNKIIDWCMAGGLPEPEFEITGTSMVLTFRKSKLTEDYLGNLGLNKRQMDAVKYLESYGQITTKEYQEVTNISKTPAIGEINDMLNKGIISKKDKGRATYYIINESFLNRTKKERKKNEKRTKGDRWCCFAFFKKAIKKMGASDKTSYYVLAEI
ncbi:MAG: hypothetical protein CVV39_09005 [Planctomycetes bacterium HGW-Planctomycetes-1]|nr:MAG: hypothetical protein CVV39_09005 [Planctomycetes bacterium HGW-Planctomycetes-1]